MELLSPAGNYECLVSAVRAGADAVYIGGASFSARRNAKNFTDEELKKACDFCHLHSVKLYVAVNILIKEKEFSDAVLYTKKLIEYGVDGIIIQDLGLLSLVRKQSDEIFINASTQMTIASYEAVEIVKNLGANRVVLARELGYKEIKSIKEKTDIELETFVHGALCMSYSGQCLISSVIGGRSGNRGLCAQPCRLNYTLLSDGKEISKNIPLLSLKDICLADKLSELEGLADSLKIEGRMKSPEYTASATALYKRALSGRITQKEIDKALSFFSRGGSSSGYFHGRTLENMMDYDVTEKVSSSRTDVVKMKEEDFSKRKAITLTLSANVGKPLHLIGECEGFRAEATGDTLEVARKEFDVLRAKEQLEKLGDTVFFPNNTKIEHSENPFVPVSAINGLRRQVCDELSQLICASYRKNAKDISFEKPAFRKRGVPKLVVEVSTKEQLDAAKIFEDVEILYSYELSRDEHADFVICPAIKKEGEITNINAPKIMVQNIGQLDAKKELYGGERLNVTNSATCRVLADFGVKRVTLSPELNVREIKEITKNTDIETEVIAYGHLPLMVMENCVIKSQGACTKSGGSYELCDRMGERFPVVCENCKNILLNSVPIFMADKSQDLLSLNVDAIRLKFTIESKEVTKKVIDAYKSALLGKTPNGIFNKITRGHFYRGAE